ncbi:pimeloyl-ACP methyl ester carboxylesterase [Aequitasia blattaphilus]|uniref:Alpha/beta hydrolase n=1 Tax=Aequitasia blattaphilus TaxID=2949332 RepID=A0ABT1EBA3_9FIRM|nr:alpha/beta fold hydrolase [Aequitasia blattaphilus]MCP1103114.1 alpha/beta hydrolase [Aequitasia blattaphilus]MCR8615754.1 alpha/beta hydrolase [Aequitasia blattaphilus]
MNWKKKFACLVSFTGMTIGAIHITNRVLSYNATKMNYLRRTSGDFFNWKFGRVFFRKQGRGKPILLIHDLVNYSSCDEWNKVFDELSKKYTVYALDLFGCGRSDKPNIIYTNYLYVQLISDFIKQVIGKKTDIVVSGSSSSFVLAACNNDKDIINQIVMVTPEELKKHNEGFSKRKRTLSWFVNLPLIGTLLYHILNRKSVIKSKAGHVDSSLLDIYFESAHVDNSLTKHVFASILGGYTNTSVIHFIKTLNNSIYIITGEDNVLNEVYENTYMEYLPAIEKTSISDTYSMPQIESPKKFIDILNIYLS